MSKANIKTIFKVKAILILAILIVPKIGFGGNGVTGKEGTLPKVKINSEADAFITALPGNIEKKFRESGLPGLSVAVVYDKEIVYSGVFGYADLEKKTPITVDTLFPIGSITKVFVATMLMQLREAGVVSLDDPVKMYVPEYQVKSPFKGSRPTTLLQLAGHVSGLPREANVNFWSDMAAGMWVETGGKTPMAWYATKQKVLESLKSLELEYPPNSRQSYSNLGMALLGIALERAAGESFEDYIKTKMLKPLGMKNSGFLLRDMKWDRFPKGYVNIGPGGSPIEAPRWELGIGLYSGGIYSTVEDMARFISLQFCEEEVGGTQIISPDGLRLMRHGSLGWGVGWGRFPVIEHTGGHLGFYAHVRAIPKLKIGIIAFTNRYNPLGQNKHLSGIVRETLDGLKQAILAGEKSAASKMKPTEPVKLEKYAGTYTLPGGGAEIKVEIRDGSLRAGFVQNPAIVFTLIPIGGDSFGIEGDRSPWFSFRTDEKGKVKNLKFVSYIFKPLKIVTIKK